MKTTTYSNGDSNQYVLLAVAIVFMLIEVAIFGWTLSEIWRLLIAPVASVYFDSDLISMTPQAGIATCAVIISLRTLFLPNTESKYDFEQLIRSAIYMFIRPAFALVIALVSRLLLIG